MINKPIKNLKEEEVVGGVMEEVEVVLYSTFTSFKNELEESKKEG